MTARPPARAGAPAALVERVPDVAALAERLDATDYLADEGLATAMFLSLRLPQPLLLEGEAGVGKTEAARALAAALGTPLIRLQCYEGMDSSEALYEWNYPRQLLRIRLAEAGGQRRRRGGPVRARVPDPPARAGGDRASGSAAGRAARRRARPRGPRLRGVPARATGRRRRDRAGARHDPGDGPAGRRAHVEPHARPARRAQAPLPVPLDRLPVVRARGRDRPPPRARQLARAGRGRRRGARAAARSRRAEAARDRRGHRLGRGARAARQRAARRRGGRAHARLRAQVPRGPGGRPRGRPGALVRGPR